MVLTNFVRGEIVSSRSIGTLISNIKRGGIFLARIVAVLFRRGAIDFVRLLQIIFCGRLRLSTPVLSRLTLSWLGAITGDVARLSTIEAHTASWTFLGTSAFPSSRSSVVIAVRILRITRLTSSLVMSS
jgi:hypothetical protein